MKKRYAILFMIYIALKSLGYPEHKTIVECISRSLYRRNK